MKLLATRHWNVVAELRNDIQPETLVSLFMTEYEANFV